MGLNVNINSWLKKTLHERINEIIPHACSGTDWVHMPDYDGTEKGAWQKYRYIQIYDERSEIDGWIHYEYFGGYVCLHLEGEYAGKKYARQARELKRKSRKHDDIAWLPRTPDCISCIIKEEVKDVNDLILKLRRLVDIFDDSLNNIYSKNVSAIPELKGKYILPQMVQSPQLPNDEVSLHEFGIADLFGLPLSIPEYQRIYCWENKQIESLWNSLFSIRKHSLYHLGTIILQNRNGKFEIVDGQQRLVTLSLILWGLGYKANIPLLNERFKHNDAIKHIKNAKAVITMLLRKVWDKDVLETIVEALRFSVIIINGNNIDLGYTFFSNQNSKGIKLSDYDLLKAHHLRYITSEPQAIHLAKCWVDLTNINKKSDVTVAQSLGKHVYRLRKLLRKDNFNEYGHYIRNEFQAAPIMTDIPPFGERFEFFEPIQGGAHFFAFANRFNDSYKTFVLLPQIVALKNIFAHYHKVYRDITESLLFSYYLKFGNQYLSEALFCILAKLAEHRFMKVRALEYQVQKYAIESNLIQFIQLSTSPTFFLASALESIRSGIMDYDINDGIRWDFYKRMCTLFSSLDDVTVTEIVRRIENEY